ncbi:zinc-ribbon domain-containing protein [Methanobrevibacter sp.]|uniref:zinc ribbon domain-containing protein n=1 Tax=Methanobrevibacter sp. TaxID=66852 RepID=UPI00388D973E
MYCEKCGAELVDGATFCSNCGNQVKAKANKNIYIALILTFILTGLGSVYAGNVKKGLILFIARMFLAILGLFVGVFFIFSFLVWAFAFHEAYRDVEIANGHPNPNLLEDFRGWDQNRQIITILIAAIIVIIVIGGSVNILTSDYSHSSDASGSSHYYSNGGGSGSSSHSSSQHYGGVDDSPSTIAKNDPDWYYDHYEYGDNQDIDDYLESEGYE